jgi:large subunit ribosomal protein L9
MKVFLIKDVETLGKAGDEVNVSVGHARNYLFPRNLAAEATPGFEKEMVKRRVLLQKKSDKEKEKVKEVAVKIDGQTIRVSAEAGDSGKLFGSVTSQEIAALIKDQLGVEIDKKKIHLDQPVKSIGTYKVGISLHSEVKASVELKVEASQEK